jgi:hypothetical protein
MSKLAGTPMPIRFAYAPDLHNSFPSGHRGRHPLLTQQEINLMTIAADLPRTVSRLSAHAALAIVADIVKSSLPAIRSWHQEAVRRRTVARLPLYLQHDIGEIDCRPSPPPSLEERHKARQSDLETMWLRYR